MPDKEEERRNEFMEAAEKLFRENGIVDTTISSIVRELDVAKGLFYYYFKSKDDVIDALSEKYNEAFNETMKASMDTPALKDRLTQYIENCIDSFHDMLARLKGTNEEADLSQLKSRSMEDARDQAIKGLQALLQEGADEGTLDVPYPHSYASVIVSGIITLVDEGEDREVISKVIMDLLSRSGKENENV